MRIVVLARHGHHDEVGQVLSGRSEIGLNKTGREEAQTLAAALSGETIASLHTSPRRRAVETMQPFADEIGRSATVTGALDEVDFGEFTGRAFAALDGDPEWDRWNAERATARCPGGETMAEAVERAADYLSALPASAFPALCVSHCDIIRGLVAHGLGLPLDRLFAFDCAPGSRTTLDWARPQSRLIALNRL